MRFGEYFEANVIAQGEFEDRTIEQTLELGWKALKILPREELLRVSEEELVQYYDTVQVSDLTK
jgi:V/A-type H+-transporting ATPase subunit B